MDLLSCSKVNKEWCEFARSERVWKRHLERVLQYFDLELIGDEKPIWQLFVDELMLNPVISSYKHGSTPMLGTALKVSSLIDIKVHMTERDDESVLAKFKVQHIDRRVINVGYKYYLRFCRGYSPDSIVMFTMNDIYVPYLCIVNDDINKYKKSVIQFEQLLNKMYDFV
jgi:hypothetical protein